MIWLVLFLSISQIVAGAIQNYDRSLAERRKFSSPQELNLNRIYLVEEKIKVQLQTLKFFFALPIKEKEMLLKYQMSKFDDEILPIRIEMNSNCINFLLQLKKLKKIKINSSCSGQINFKKISDKMIRLVKSHNDFFEEICQSLEEFTDKYGIVLEFDQNSRSCCDQFNNVVNQYYAYACIHNFSIKNIPLIIRPKYEQ